MLNMNNALAELLKKIRKEKNISQFQLSLLTNIPRSVISMIESGHRIPSAEYLVILSNKLDFDFITFLNEISKYKKLEHYLLYNDIASYINSSNITGLNELLQSNPLIDEFDYGDCAALKIYCEVLIDTGINNDMDSVFEKCTNYLNVNSNNLDSFKPKIGMSNHYYSLFFSLAYCFYGKEDFESMYKLYTVLIDFSENVYFNENISPFNTNFYHKKFYVFCLNNIADVYFCDNQFDTALIYCNKGISKCGEFNILNALDFLLKLKTQILYKLENITDAKNAYKQFELICQITEKTEYFNTSTDLFRTNYPLLFE